MALPTIQGRGFIIGDIVLRPAASGLAVANFPVAFNKSKKNEDTDEWERTHEIVVRATAFGELAEYIVENFAAKVDIDLTGELHTETFKRKDGSEGSATKLTVRTVGAPVEKRKGGGQSRQRAAKSEGSNPWGSNPASNPANDW